MTEHNKYIIKKTGKILAWSLGGVFALIIIFLTGLTLYLTPERLSEIVNREANENLQAEVKAHNIRFTIWSSFPHLRIEMDSVRVISKTLAGISKAQRDSLPDDADYLLSTGAFRGGINLARLLSGKIALSKVEVEDLDVNLVAVTDSITNYSIVPNSTGPDKIPYFTADKVTLHKPRRLRWFSLPSQAQVGIDLKDATLIRDKKNKNLYDLKVAGNIDALVGALQVLQGFPFELGGNVHLAFDPFAIKTDNYSISLGEMRGNIDLNMQMGEDVKVNQFAYRIDNFNLNDFLARFPGLSLPTLDSLDANLVVNASARLTSPYNFSSTALPSAEVDFKVVDGDFCYTLSDNHKFVVHHEGAEGKLVFDGTNPDNSYFVIPPFSLTGEGTDLTLAAEAVDLMGSPIITASVKGKSGLDKIGHAVEVLRGCGLKGELLADADVRFRMDNISGGNIHSLDIKGNVSLTDFAGSMPGQGMSASAERLDFFFGGKAGDLGTDSLSDGRIRLNGETGRFAFKNGSTTISGDRLDLKGFCDLHSGDFMPDNFLLNLDAARLAVTSREARVNLRGVAAEVSAKKSDKPISVSDYKMPSEWMTDARSQKFVDHSPAFLQVKLNKGIRDLMAQWRVGAQLNLKAGEIRTDAFPLDNHIRNVDIAASFDSVAVRSLELRSGSSGMNINGKITNLRQFLNSSTPAPLLIDLNVAMDTVQINQLARAYEHGQKKTKGVAYTPAPDSVSAADTVALLIPRNLIANVRASARETRYTNLHLYDLSTGLKLKDGNANVDDLKISADFGRAYMDLAYNSSDIQRMGINAELGVEDINVVNFFKNFHTLLLMMPQMSNLSGILSAHCNLSLLSFPNMYVNVPSVNGKINLQGRDLVVHQSDFIRHLTRMMLIHQSGDLHIANMNVNASIHDNLLELYPFRFEVDRYLLKVVGLNNFNGDLYYHIGVDKSPIPFKFGLNVEGNISHPHIRFGGESFKVEKGEEITSSIMETHYINIVSMAKKYMKEFIHKAAISDGTN